MAPEHVFSTAAKLCADVLGGAADGGLDLAAAAEVVGDALRLLASKHMKARRVVAHCGARPRQCADACTLQCHSAGCGKLEDMLCVKSWHGGIRAAAVDEQAPCNQLQRTKRLLVACSRGQPVFSRLVFTLAGVDGEGGGR